MKPTLQAPLVLAAGVLAGCAAAVVTAPEADRAAQARACDEAVALHVKRSPDAVATIWRETGPASVAIFEARDGDRLHTCEVDAAGRVLRLDHPR